MDNLNTLTRTQMKNFFYAIQIKLMCKFKFIRYQSNSLHGHILINESNNESFILSSFYMLYKVDK